MQNQNKTIEQAIIDIKLSVYRAKKSRSRYESFLSNQIYYNIDGKQLSELDIMRKHNPDFYGISDLETKYESAFCLDSELGKFEKRVDTWNMYPIVRTYFNI